jgi:hypothetical protein
MEIFESGRTRGKCRNLDGVRGTPTTGAWYTLARARHMYNIVEYSYVEDNRYGPLTCALDSTIMRSKVIYDGLAVGISAPHCNGGIELVRHIIIMAMPKYARVCKSEESAWLVKRQSRADFHLTYLPTTVYVCISRYISLESLICTYAPLHFESPTYLPCYICNLPFLLHLFPSNSYITPLRRLFLVICTLVM